jgi:predicted MFS family arabinose efflux permease
VARVTGHWQDTSFDVNSRSARWSALLFGVVSVQTFILQPGFVQGFVEHLRFTEQQAGLVASAEIGGIAATSLAFAFLSSRLNWRRAVLVCAILAGLADLASAFATDFTAFAGLRFVAGLGLGGLASLSWAAIGLTKDPDRGFALYVGWCLVYGAAGIFALPMALAMIGMSGVMIALSLMTLASAPCARFMPVSADNRGAPNPDALEISGAMKALVLAGVLTFNVALSATWAYLFLVGVDQGIGEQVVANVLALSQLAAVLGAVVPYVMAQKFGRIAPLTLGLLGCAASAALLAGRTSLLSFAIGVSVFNFLWNVVLPYTFASLSSFDRSGRMVVYGVAVQMIGLGIGPAVGAAVLESGDLGSILLMSAVLILASLAMILVASLHHRARWRAELQPVR